MTPLAKAFEAILPRLLAHASPGAGVVAFVATSGAETGTWIVDLAVPEVRRAAPADRPTTRVEASAEVLALLLAGQLDAARALAHGALVVRGDPAALTHLARAL